MSKLMSLFLLMMLSISCGDNHSHERENGYSDVASSPEDSLFKKVMDGHDEGMARMGKLSGYRKQLEQELDSLKKNNPKLDRNVEAIYTDVRNSLKQAEDGMNRWMDEFKIDSAEGKTDERMEYLRHEQEKVEKVKNDILSALQRADSLMAKKEAD